MRYAYFPGCKIPYHLPQYGQATRSVCDALGIGLVDVEFGCCGYPVRHSSFEASMFTAARNFVLAAELGLPLLTPCKCCFGNLRHAVYWIRENRELRALVKSMLANEGLACPEPEEMRVSHLLTVLDQGVGPDKIRDAVKRPLSGVPVAAHYGCHALRPGYVTGFANPLSPRIFERLLQATGAAAVDWPQRLECCGNPLWGKNDAMAAKLATRKLVDARNAGRGLAEHGLYLLPTAVRHPAGQVAGSGTRGQRPGIGALCAPARPGTGHRSRRSGPGARSVAPGECPCWITND